MNASEFVMKISQLAPEKDLLLNVGYSKERAEAYLQKYNLIERQSLLGLVTNNDQFLELINAWDLSTLPIGPLDFFEFPIVQTDLIELGKLELDKLVFDLKSKEFLLLSYENDGRVIGKAASSGKDLLDALFLISEFFTMTSTEQVDIDDESEGEKMTNKCVALLGGAEFEVFCGMMTGY